MSHRSLDKERNNGRIFCFTRGHENRSRRRWDKLVTEHHYLKNAQMVDEQLRYGVEYRGEWVAMLGWSAAGAPAAGRQQRPLLRAGRPETLSEPG